jgi:multiple sugar transport system permease protein
MPRTSLFEKTGRLLLALIAILWSCGPVYLIVASSFKEPRDIFAVPPSLVFHPILDNYRLLFSNWPQFLRGLVNSLSITVGATLLTIVISSLAGYALARFKGRGLAASAFYLLLVRMFPPIVLILPLFVFANRFGLNDTHILLIVLYSAFFVSLSSWIMKSFVEKIPIELEESAAIDGARLWRTLRSVILPLSINGIVASSVFIFVYSWNEYLYALVFTTRNARTAPLVLSEILGAVEGVQWGVLFAAVTLQLIPILVFVVAVQRFIMAGLTAGGVKG